MLKKQLLLLLTIIFTACAASSQVRLKDITDIKGFSDTQVIGYGLVVGLDGSGDGTKAQFTINSIVNMMERFGLNVDARQIKPRNAAAVMVTADLSPYARVGSRIDVMVSSVGDANSLEGGVLLMAPLLGVDGRIYVQAQGPVSIGGLNAAAGGAQVQVNHPLVGRIPAGGLVTEQCQEFPVNEGMVSFLLRNPDYTTASRIAEALNIEFGEEVAKVVDAGTVETVTPSVFKGYPSTMEFIARAEAVTIEPDVPARVVINERTGTVVVGDRVRISTVAIAHGSLTISVTTTPQVSQPPPLSAGETVATSRPEITVDQPQASMMVVDNPPGVGEIAGALNALGVTPRDIVAIFQALKRSGALQAELIII